MVAQSPRSDDLSEIVSEFGPRADLPSTRWLIRLDLQRPIAEVHVLGPWTRIFKRCVDVVGAGTLLIALAPVMAIVAGLVKMTSPGPVLYRQVRTGLNLRRTRDRRVHHLAMTDRERRAGTSNRRVSQAYGRPFVMYKFRTMRIDAEQYGAQLAVQGDLRVTRIGRILRKLRLDELPQLWNVLRGEMSLVGPRPERPEFVEQLSQEIPNYLVRLGMKPGITGLAQVLNGYDNELEGFRRKVALDLLYLQNYCFWNDVKIQLRTIAVVLTGKGAL